MSAKGFSALEMDAIGEVLNISLGSSATALSTMLSARVEITTPIVKVVTDDEFQFKNLEPAIGVEITYIEGLTGSNIMLLKRLDVKAIVEILMGCDIPDEEFELNEMNISAICEVMNQMMGASSTALSEFLGKVVNISTPVSFEIHSEQEFKDKYFTSSDSMVVIGFTLKIAEKLESEFINVMPTELAKSLVSAFIPEGMAEAYDDAVSESPMVSMLQPDALPSGSGMLSQEEIEKLLQEASGVTEPTPEPSSGGGMMSQEEIEKMLQAASGAVEPTPEPSSGGGMMSQEEIEKMLQAASGAAEPAPTPQQAPQQAPQPVPQPIPQMQMTGQPMMGMDPMLGQQLASQQQLMQQMLSQMQLMQQQMMNPPKQADPKKIQARSIVHQNLEGESNSGEEQQENLELIMGVPLEVTVEIGRTKRLVKDILEFSKGSLVVLDKLAGDQVDLLVNGQCVAKGDVVVVDDSFGIRITEIVQKPEF